ncbi:hypothetical protein ANCDUO_22523 [Ancylostoma duodenale]|uniref:Uncharacterized protein n=1 Tax=Ancylostoma duodenale TaxID=51022 RepID=A0A0C2FFQ0_9BILA|nr:hypothetical protein ANCDUO_22523 [Ancylostoma duodenale]
MACIILWKNFGKGLVVVVLSPSLFSSHLLKLAKGLMFVTITATCFNWATNVDMLMISDAIRGDDSSPYGHFHSLITSFYLPNALLLVSTALFLVAAYTFVNDNRRFKEYMGVLKPSTLTPSLQSGTRKSTGADNWAFSVPEGDHPETTKV